MLLSVVAVLLNVEPVTVRFRLPEESVIMRVVVGGAGDRGVGDRHGAGEAVRRSRGRPGFRSVMFVLPLPETVEPGQREPVDAGTGVPTAAGTAFRCS